MKNVQLKFLLIFAFLFFGAFGVEYVQQNPTKALNKIQTLHAQELAPKTFSAEKKFYTVTFINEARADEAPAAKVVAPPVLVDPNADAIGIISDAYNKILSAKALGGQAMIMAIIVILLGLVKNSFMRAYFWDKLGWGKAFIAPALALLYVYFNVKTMGGGELFAALTTGFGALALHELLDAVKGIPGLGSIYVAIIDLVGSILKKPEAKV